MKVRHSLVNICAVKMPAFRYHRPSTVEEAIGLLAEYGSDAKVLAGGQSLVPLLALRLSHPEHLVDIGRIAGLDGAEDGPDGFTIGAAARHADVELSPVTTKAAPLVAAAMPHIGHRAIRNRGTVCGSLAHADPAAELPAVALATGAELIARSSTGERRIPAADFFLGYLTSALDETEVLTAVRFPPWPGRTGWSVQEISRRHGDYALVGVGVQLELAEDGTIARAGIGMCGAGAVPIKATEAETLLQGEAPTEALFVEASVKAAEQADPEGDIHATADYRRDMVRVLTARGLRLALARMGA
jgi:aerobic carbon-monoxide dehydrogenase medium subunit